LSKLKRPIYVVVAFLSGVLLYVLASITSFNLTDFTHSSYGLSMTIILTSIGGVAALFLGYESVIVLGGRISLGLAEFVSRLNRSMHVIEEVDDGPQGFYQRFIQTHLPILVVILVFLLSLAIGWDVHNLHGPAESLFHPLLHEFDVFSKPTGTDIIAYSVEVVPDMLVIVALAGVAPSIIIPYLRKFKITGVNSEPFHTFLLSVIVGFVAGLSLLFTLVGFIFNVLWMGKGPRYFHFALLAMLGLSVHYTIGVFLGREKSESIVGTKLKAESHERVAVGKVNIQTTPSKKDTKKNQ
jgi:hypothetical protein